MAVVAKSTKASFDVSTGMIGAQITGLIAGEDIPSAVTPCQIKADGKVWRASGAAADSNAVIAGWSTRKAKTGQPITLWGAPALAKYADETLTPGQKLYLGTAGALDTAATTGDAVGIAQAVTASVIRLTRLI